MSQSRTCTDGAPGSAWRCRRGLGCRKRPPRLPLLPALCLPTEPENGFPRCERGRGSSPGTTGGRGRGAPWDPGWPQAERDYAVTSWGRARLLSAHRGTSIAAGHHSGEAGNPRCYGNLLIPTYRQAATVGAPGPGVRAPCTLPVSQTPDV